MSRLILSCVVALCSSLPTFAQPLSEYQYVKKAFKAVENYKHAPYHIKSNVAGKFGYDSSQWLDDRNMVHYLDRDQSETFTEQNGVITYSAWDGGLCMRYNRQLLFHSWSFLVQGVAKSRPTGHVTFQVSQQGITIKIYNDVQYNCDFNESGQPKAPPCPFTELLECKTGSRVEGAAFSIVGVGFKKFKTRVSCQHSRVQLLAGYGGGSERWNADKGEFENVGSGSDPYSPWKYKHTLTIKLTFDELAKVAGVSRQELIRQLVLHGFKSLLTDTVLQSVSMVSIDNNAIREWVSERLEPLNNILCYRFFKESCISMEQLQAEHEKIEQAKEAARQEELRKVAFCDSLYQVSKDIADKAMGIYKSYTVSQQDLEQASALFDAAGVAAGKAYRFAKTLNSEERINKALKDSVDYKFFYQTALLYRWNRRFTSRQHELDRAMLDYKQTLPHFCYMLYREFALDDVRAGDMELAIQNMNNALEALDYFCEVREQRNKPVDEEMRDSVENEYQFERALYHYPLALQRFEAKDYEGFSKEYKHLSNLANYYKSVSFRIYKGNNPGSREAKELRNNVLDILGELGSMFLQLYEPYKDVYIQGHNKMEKYRSAAFIIMQGILKIDPDYLQGDAPFAKNMNRLFPER